MKAKKTIAAIAALMLAVSSVSSLPFAVSANADDVPAASENSNTETTDVPEYDANNEVSPLADTGVAVQSELATVITAADFADLTDEEKAEYTQVTMQETPDMFVTYLKEGEVIGTNIYNGSYVKKGTEIYLCNPVENFHGSQFLVLSSADIIAEELYTSYNGSDAWIASYVIGNTDNSLYISVSNGAAYGVLTPNEYSQLGDEMKPYYTQVNVQAPAYVWIGDEEDGGEVANGNYVLKNLFVWIAMLFDDYMDNDILLNGEVVNAQSSGGSSNFGISYRIRPDDDVINIASQATTCPKSTVNITNDYKGITVSYYVDGWTNGKAIEDGEQVRIGTPLLIGTYKNLAVGCDIYVNGELLPLHINGDNTYMLSGYTPDTDEMVIDIVERELNDYEKANFVPVNMGNSIYAVEFPFSLGQWGDEWHVTYGSGANIAKGSNIRFVVAPADYEGKILKINGQTVNMVLNGDGSNYLYNYVIPNNSSAINVTLEDAPVIPSAPSAPSSNPVVTSPTAPSTPAPSASAAAAPSAKSVVNDLKTSGKSSISYNASEAGVTKDILTAFAKNKSAKTMTAKFDNFKVKIKKSDIEDAKALEGIDFSVKEKDFISKSQINKTNALKNSKKVVQLNFESSADVSGLKKVNIQAKAGKSFTDNTAVVYELKGNKLVKVGTAKVDLNGYVSFNTDHLGQFVVAVK